MHHSPSLRAGTRCSISAGWRDRPLTPDTPWFVAVGSSAGAIEVEGVDDEGGNLDCESRRELASADPPQNAAAATTIATVDTPAIPTLLDHNAVGGQLGARRCGDNGLARWPEVDDPSSMAQASSPKLKQPSGVFWGLDLFALQLLRCHRC